MSNPNFIAVTSTNEIYRDLDEERCLTDDLDTIEDDIAELQESVAGIGTGKANASHTHGQSDVNGLADALAGKAAANHSHTAESVGAAPAEHTHTAESVGAATTDHTHNYAAPTHTHGQGDVTGLADALAGKANTTHTHTPESIGAVAPADLAAKADLVDGKVPASQLPSYVSDVQEYANLAAFPTAGESDKIYLAQDTNKSYRWGGTAYVEIGGGVALGETSSTAHRGDHGKTAYEHSQNGNVHVTEAKKIEWDGKAAGDHNHNALYAALAHKHNATCITATGHDLNDYTEAGIWSFAASAAPANMPTSNSNGWLVVIPWKEGNATIKQFWLRHGTLGSNDFCTYVRTKIGSSAWGAWSQFYTTSNPPTAAEVGAIAKSLQFTSDNGNVQFSFNADSGKNILTEIDSWGIGFHTAYAIGGTEGNPNTSDSFRFLVHKTSANIGWVLAFGGSGTIYVNYEHAGAFRGWRQLYSTLNPPTAAEVGAISKALQFTADNGDVKENLSGKNVLSTIKAKAIGFYTFYSEAGTTGNPQASFGWRYLVHKTDVNHGWVLAFGSDGSIFTNYLSDGTWLGWKTVFDATPTALWRGTKVMTSSETITPSKKLSECRNGWMLEFSDYNNDSSSAANTNFVQLPIFKRNTNGDWDGRNMMFPVPNYISDDGATVGHAIKQLIVHDNKLVGHVANDKNSANLDVCLRAVYEF